MYKNRMADWQTISIIDYQIGSILSCVDVLCNSEENINSPATQTVTPLGNASGEKLSVATLNEKTQFKSIL